MIEITNLTKHYGRIHAVNDISFTVQPGEIVGFLGPNGAGKTTTMNILTGYIPSTSGIVKVGGYDVMEDPQKVKSQIGYLPEQPPLYFDLTVLEYLMFVAELKKVKKTARKPQVNEAMELMMIDDHKNRLVKNLSKGYKQRVGFAQALIGEPEVLILDEPTIGLDPKQIIEIRRLIKSLGKKHTIILSSHILQEVSAVCERVIIINKGRIAAVDTPENLSKGMGDASRLSLTVAGSPAAIVSTVLDIYGVTNIEKTADREQGAANYIVESNKDIDIRKPLFFALAKISCPILEMRSLSFSLEEIFLELIASERESSDSVSGEKDGMAGGGNGGQGANGGQDANGGQGANGGDEFDDFFEPGSDGTGYSDASYDGTGAGRTTGRSAGRSAGGNADVNADGYVNAAGDDYGEADDYGEGE